MEDRCVICGDKIPEGRQVCPNCSGNEAGVFESLMKSKDIQFEADDRIEQAYRQGYVEGVKSQAKEELVICITGAIQSIRAVAEKLIDRAEIESAYDAEKTDREIEELKEKHWSECRQISEYEQENRKLKQLLRAALDSMNAICENVREECGEAACGSCEYDSPLTESGEMLYECPGCDSKADCFKWKHEDEVLELIGETENE